MKRFIAAASLAAFATSAFAVATGKPYEQVEIDRALPSVAQSQASATVYPYGGSAPYEQFAVDRALPGIALLGERTQFAAAAGETRSDAAADVVARGSAASPFAKQHDFVAPAP